MPANVRIYLSGERADKQLLRKTTRAGQKVRAAARGAARDVMNLALERIKDDLSSAGSLGERYLPGLKGAITEGGGNIRVSITDDVPGFNIFNTGGTIEGHPLLWIPLTGVPHVPASEYPGRLFRVERSATGQSLLMDPADRKVKYTGHESVEIKKKFHSIEIVNDASRELGRLYKERYAALGE